eukprot:4866551-Pleurochrysis_carterae.AAC.1
MNHAGQSQEGSRTRRIGKSCDPDHQFHPCDDVDSDDPAIEALLESSSNHTQSSHTHGSEIDYDPAYPYMDPFTRVSPSTADGCEAGTRLDREARARLTTIERSPDA